MLQSNVLYYISGFGFGHLTRSLALLEAMLIQKSSLQVTVKCHPQQKWFISRYLAIFADRVNLQDFDSIFSLVFDPVRLGIDFMATIKQVEIWIDKLEDTTDGEIAKLNQDYDLVISDIVPEAFGVAEALGVPGLGVSNFTWYEICKDFMPPDRLKPLLSLYEKATILYEYDLSTGDEIPIRPKCPVGLLSRPMDRERIKAIRQRYKRPGRLLMFLSVGGDVSLTGLSLCPEIDFLYTRGINLSEKSNAWEIPAAELHTHNYLAACDGVITKCGWSTVAEALVAKKPLFIMKSSTGWLEERHILGELRNYEVATEVEASQLANLTCELFQDGMKIADNYENKANLFVNQAHELAKKIMIDNLG